MRNGPYWLNTGSILHQYGCATRVWALGHVCPSTSNNFISGSLYNKPDSQLSKYCVVYATATSAGAGVSNSSSFDQYCISYKTITGSQGAAAAPGPEVSSECPITYFPALPLLATNPSDATVVHMCLNHRTIVHATSQVTQLSRNGWTWKAWASVDAHHSATSRHNFLIIAATNKPRIHFSFSPRRPDELVNSQISVCQTGAD